MKSKIIITGGTGYIGSHTAVEFINEGLEVVIVDNLSNSDISVLDRIQSITDVAPTFENIDLTDRVKTTSFFERHKDASGVINFAAFKAVGESVQLPLQYYHNNLNILLNVMDCMDRFEIRNLIFSSSATVYGLPDSFPLTENSKTKKPTSPYGNTKKIGEEVIEDFSKVAKNFKAISLRYFNPIGAHSSGDLGETPTGVPNNLMPFITQTALGKREELKIFGKDYDTIDGTAIRDYIHVVDLAKAHVMAFQRLMKNEAKENFEIFNIGTGIGYSVLDVIASFEKTTKQKLNYSFVDRRSGDVPVLYASTAKAKKELGWNPKLTLDDMTKSSWEWEVKKNIL
ncbi:MAG: UDP-glucose 4-epimerase GalE [Lutibacter sp.]|uniref:UDP-glucose 4-epimerase GalE n=1 Tax=Lutibacter sp. TaxID=1925666 RepID=UPI0017BA7295|nr:UDP-glucose 4-epimerase GalE [Lutibacter sp.]MBT8318154.1 UDP-glucose 4-epimerase GalE [Lutibacter sp.]NNJ59014.1 UDP-glucose 4-epimerase GalE [Lutibacter sp.]